MVAKRSVVQKIYDTQRFNEVLNGYCNFGLENNNSISTHILKLMIMYRQIKIDCKKLSSSVDMVESVIFDYMSLQCDIDLEDSKPIFLHNTLAHEDASSNLITKCSAVEETSSRRIFTGIFSYLSCDLDPDHKITIQFFHRQSTF